ncbi:MAG: class I SAM-dependent methyltransferase [Halomonas sp.]|nr:class I SAM-dependent methyltransferase [Halomonas sp.]
MNDLRLQSPATARNRQPILEVLRQVLPDSARVLEVASGSGEHALHCAADMPSWIWQPSDPNPRALASIAAWRQQAGLPNLAEPVRLDVTDFDSWPAGPFEAIVAINLIHISPWAVTEALMAGAGSVLVPGGVLFLYGPFRRGGLHVAPSNAAFDADLRRRDSRWGVRDLEQVTAEAERHGLTLERLVEMPANNLSVVFR